MDTPQSYARQLATYIASPTKIEALTRIEFGRAPDLHKIAQMRLAVERGDRNLAVARRELKLAERDAAREAEKAARLKAEQAAAREAEDEAIRAAVPFTKHLPPTGNPFLQPWRLTHAVVESVAADFEILPEHILGKARHTHLINARSVAVKLLIDQGLGFAELGRRLGRDHSTIIHRYRQFEVDCRSPLVRQSYARHLALLEEARAAQAEEACAA